MMIDQPMLVYVRRLLYMSVLYGMLVLSFVWAPAHCVVACFPSIMPFHVKVSHPGELAAFGMCVPIVKVRVYHSCCH